MSNNKIPSKCNSCKYLVGGFGYFCTNRGIGEETKPISVDDAEEGPPPATCPIRKATQ